MPAELIPIDLNNPATRAIAAGVVILAIALMLFLFSRSRSRKRQQEALARERLIEMERVSQFAAAVDHVAHSRKPREVASSIAGLFSQYLSMQVLAVYAARESEWNLPDVFRVDPEASDQPVRSSNLPDSVPASLLHECARPEATKLSAILSLAPTSSAALAAEPVGYKEESLTNTPEDAQVLPSHLTADQAAAEPAIGEDEEVIVLPWRGPFQWNGLIVASLPSGVTASALDSYAEPFARLTDRLALALEFEDSDAALQTADEQASRTADFSRSVVASLEAPSPLEAIVCEVQKFVGSDSAALWRMDETGGMIRMAAAHGLRSSEFLPLPLGQGFAGSVAAGAELVSIEDAPADPRCIFPRETRESGIASYLAAPLTADGKTLGVMEAHSATRRSWSAHERRSLASAATIIAELVKSTDSRGNRLRVETAYLGLSEALQRLRSAEEVKEAVVEVLGHALGASRVLVAEFNEQDQPQAVSHEYRQPSVKSALGATFGVALAARLGAADGGQPIAISDSTTESLIGVEAAAEFDILSELAMPIRADGKVRAITYVHQCDRVREWDEEEIEFADRVVRQMSLSLSNLRVLGSAFDNAKRAQADAGQAKEMAAALPEALIGLDSEGKLSYFNVAAKDRLGLTRDDLDRTVKGTRAWPLFDEAAWQKIAECETVTRLDSRLKAQMGGSEEPIPVSVSAAPLRNDDGEITGRVVVITDVSHLEASGAEARIKDLEKRVESFERVLSQSRTAEEEARTMLARASALEAKARDDADASRRAAAEARSRLESALESRKQAQGSAQQLLEINRLKSEFIVNAGHGIEASLQSVLGMAELLEGGSYGNLTPAQQQAVHEIYGWARRIKGDVDWLVEYGSTRSRRLETSGGS